MNSNIGPNSTSKQLKTVTVTGMLFPWDGAQPVLLSMPGSDYFYLPLFESEEKLRDLMGKIGVAFVSIKHIDDGPTFLASIYENPAAWETVRVIANPYFHTNGRIRFVQIKLPDA